LNVALAFERLERVSFGWHSEGQISYLKDYHRLGGWFPREAKDPASVR
jgi:hypothetical protein